MNNRGKGPQVRRRVWRRGKERERDGGGRGSSRKQWAESEREGGEEGERRKERTGKGQKERENFFFVFDLTFAFEASSSTAILSRSHPRSPADMSDAARSALLLCMRGPLQWVCEERRTKRRREGRESEKKNERVKRERGGEKRQPDRCSSLVCMCVRG